MIDPPFAIGQAVFVVSAGLYEEDYVKCPLCDGTSYVTLIVGSTGEKLEVICGACSEYSESRHGYLRTHKPSVSVIPCHITGLSMSYGEWRIETDSRYATDSIHATREAADAAAERRLPELHAEREEVIKRNMLQAAKKATWSAHYSRREIAEAERVIAWHTKRLKNAKALPVVDE